MIKKKLIPHSLIQYIKLDKSQLLLVQIVIGSIICFFGLIQFFSGEKNFENLALGTMTVPYQATDENNHLIHIFRLNKNEIVSIHKGWEERGKKDVLLVFGNSQTHSINQIKKGDITYIQLLFDSLRSNSYDVLGISYPNASIQEFYLSFTYLKQHYPIKYIIIPFFLDDTREDGIRDVFFPYLIQSQYQIQNPQSPLSQNINKELQAYRHITPDTTQQAKQGTPALQETFQEKSESILNNKLDTFSIAWRNRPNVRGEIFNWLYQARNTVLGINANTVRHVIPDRYAKNSEALKLIIEDCMKNNIKILLYIPPIRSDIPIPYDSNEYSKASSELKKWAEIFPEKIFFKNYTNIVPGQFWGYKEATNLVDKKEIDYMHFQYSGHRILFDSIYSVITSSTF